jgi:ATP-dependent DNA helicase RecG
VPLLRAMDELVQRVAVRDQEAEVNLGTQRIGRPLFDPVAIRELIANALVHRDFARLGTVLVQISDHVLTVSNPGGFPQGVTVANLLSTPPTPRNHTLADVFKRAGLVDRTSRGVNRVFERQLRNGRPPPDYSDSTGESVVVRLAPGDDASTFTAATSLARVWDGTLSLDDLRVLYEIERNGSVSVSRTVDLLGVEETAARRVLARLIYQRFVQMTPDRSAVRFAGASTRAYWPGIVQRSAQPGEDGKADPSVRAERRLNQPQPSCGTLRDRARLPGFRSWLSGLGAWMPVWARRIGLSACWEPCV